MELKFTEVVSVTSEDPRHPAEALLRNEKWLSAPNSKHSHIEAVLQLSETSPVGSIHIGNCGSAFISVMVAKKGSSVFTPLLPQSTFMSVLDCKLSKNKTQVRMFNQSDFLPEARDDTWSQVKVMCSQPFNMFMQYGVSFVRVFPTPGVRTEGKDASPSSWQAFKRLSTQQATGDSPRKSSTSTSSLLSRSERLIHQSAKILRTPDKRDFHNRSPQKRVSVSPTSEVRVIEEEEKNCVEEEDDDIFKVKAVSFLETLELHKKSLQNIELGHVAKEFETALGRQLTVKEKNNFTEILRAHLKSLKNLQTRRQSSSPKCVASGSSFKCKSPASQQRQAVVGGGPEDGEVTPRKIVVKSCSPGWLSNIARPGTGGRESEHPLVDSSGTPVRCSSTGCSPSNSVVTGGQGLGGGGRITGLSPRMRRNIVSAEDVEVDMAGSPSQSKLPTPLKENWKRVHPSPSGVIESSSKKQCGSKNTDDCVIVSSVARNEDSTGDLLVQCPICTKYFDSSEVQSHAESCESYIENDIGNNFVRCPLCSKKINKDEARSHADSCARMMFGD